MDIYILHEGQESGPFTDEAAQVLLAEGKALANDYAWRPGLEGWIPLSEILSPESAKAEAAKAEPASELETEAEIEPATETPAREEAASTGEVVAPVEAVRAESEAVVEETPAEEERPVTEATAEPKSEVVSEIEPARAPEPIKVEANPEPKAAAKDKSKSETAVIEVKPPEPELATEKQKALLNFLGITIAKDLTKDRASGIVNDAMENSKYTAQVAQWNEMKLQLHPELFAAEIQARRENRANQYFDLCQTTGAEYFTGITKAHCQVLVGFLDVKFPQWDARGADSAERYFFPAVAEKFPQLVNKQWRGRLNYGEAKAHDSARLKKSPTSKVKAKGTSPIAAVAKGVFLGGLILCVLYGGYVAAQRLPGTTLKDKLEGLTHLKVVSTPSSAATPDQEEAPAKPAPTPTVAAVTQPEASTAAEPPVPAPAPAPAPAAIPEPIAPAPAVASAPVAMTDPAPAPVDPTMAPPAAAAPTMAAAPEPAPAAPLPGMATLPGMAALPEPAPATPPAMGEPAPMATGTPIAPGIPTLPDTTPAAPMAVPAAPPTAAAPPAMDPTAGIPLSSSIANAPVASLPGMEPTAPAASVPAIPPAVVPPATAAVPPPAVPEPAPALPPGLPPPTMPADGAAVAPAAVRTSLILTKPVDVQLAYGKLTLPAGTAVKLISRQGATLRIGYQNNVITIPVASTDLE